jgi:hypothetical protein
MSLGAEVPRQTVESYLRPFGEGESLDLVHLACLARCWADVGGAPEAVRRRIAERVETFRCSDGGYEIDTARDRGSAYGCFLAAGAQEDVLGRVVDARGLVRCLESLRNPDGSYAASREVRVGTTPTTAAAVTLLRRLGQEVDPAPARWLMEQHRDGGFLAAPGAPAPDLLSTGVALHALASAGTALDEIRERCVRFVRSLQDGTGGFRANEIDPTPDCEYTWYALLSLGLLAAEPGPPPPHERNR